MGFSEALCRRALTNTGSADDAVNWLFEHQDDDAANSADRRAQDQGAAGGAGGNAAERGGGIVPGDPYYLCNGLEADLFRDAGDCLLNRELIDATVPTLGKLFGSKAFQVRLAHQTTLREQAFHFRFCC